MFGPEREQIRVDRHAVPRYLDGHIPEEAFDGAVKMTRQVNGVTTYLSWAATGEVRHREGMAYAAALAAIDVVTDYHKAEVDGPAQKAIRGEFEYDCLELVPKAVSAARSEGVATSIDRVAYWQDKSLEQFEDPAETDLVGVTHGKGGASALGHLFAVKEDVTHEEAEFMHEFGYVMQLLDDYVDQPEDEEEGISTLFTEGYLDGDDLEEHRQDLHDRMEDLWGFSTATKRFRRLTRMHKRLGDFVNRTGIPPERIVPYYF